MLRKCRQAIDEAAQAAGRPIPTDAQAKAIEDRISSAMVQLAREDNARWRTLTRDQQMTEAADKAMKDIAAEAERKLNNAELQIVKTAEADARIVNLQESFAGTKGHDGTRAEAFKRDMVLTGHMAAAERKMAFGQLTDLIEAAGDKTGVGVGKKFLMAAFNAENPVMRADIAREIFRKADGHTKNPVAKAAAEAWLKTIEGLRTRFNNAGGDVGKVDYGWLPQPWDTAKIRKGRDAFATFLMDHVDRSRMLREDGSRMSGEEVFDFLNSASETLATEGLNKSDPGAYKGTGARANKGKDHRQIHLKDGDSWVAVMEQYGKGSLYDAMMGHIGGMTRDITLVERYGPDANANARLQMDLAVRMDEATTARPVGTFSINPQTYWDILSGKTGAPADVPLAETMAMVRNLQVAAKLGGAVISSVTDLGTLVMTAGYNKLPYWQLIKDIGGQASKETREWMSAHGMIAESVSDALNRWSGDHLGTNWSGKMANSVMRWSLLNAWTDGLRQGFTMSMNAGLARMAKKTWGELHEFDRSRLTRAGFTEADWQVLNSTPVTQFKGRELLTPQSILNADVAAHGERLQRISDKIRAATDELSRRNAEERGWISGRIVKFDEARDALNRSVKALLANKLKSNEKATGPLLERMALLDAQREQAKLHSDMEADFNRFVTQDEVRSFLNAVEDGASADKADIGKARPAVRGGLESAESIGRKYGEAKGRLERHMRELEQRIAGMDREAYSAANEAGKTAQRKADAMAAELRDFIARSTERQKKRQAVIERLEREESIRIDAEAQKIRREIAAKVFGFIHDESEYAVVNPDMATRAIVTMGGQQAGTYGGEIARTVMQFKSFPVAMMTRHWARMLEGDHGADGAPLLANRVLYGMALLATATGLGAVATQEKQILAGKDPIDMSKGRFWMKALAQGGGFGIAGDLFLIDPASSGTDSATTAIKNLAGPTVGTATELVLKNVTENVWQAADGKDTHWEAELAGWAKAQTPGANLWWVKPMIDHGFMNAVNENLSPGYLSRVEQRAMKDWGQRYWWKPRDTLPQRAPELEKAIP